MLKEIIDFGLTAANILSLVNYNSEDDTKEKRKKIRETNKNISNFRNAAYIARRLVK